MPGPWDLTPNRTLGMGAAIAQGLEKGLGAYQNQVQRNQQQALALQAAQGQAELRRLQMMKLQQEVAPIQFSAWKYAMISKAADAGMIPESIKAKAAQGVVEQADSPAKISFLNGLIDKQQQARLQQMNPMDLSRAMGGGDSDVITAQMPKAYSGPVNGQMPNAAPNYLPQPTPAPQDAPESFSLTPKEAAFYGNLYKAKNSAGVGYAGIQQRGDAAQMQFLQAMEGHRARYAAAQNETDRKAARDEMEDLLKRYLGDTGNQTKKDVAQIGAGSREKVAGINAGAKVQSAKIRGAGKGGAAADPMQKSLLKQIEATQKAMTDLGKPNSLGIAPMDSVVAKQRAQLQSQLDGLKAQYNQMGGKSYPGTAPVSGQPAGKAPGGPKIQVLSGSAEEVKAQAKKMPDGQPYQVGKMTFVNEKGAPKPYVQQGRAPQSVEDASYPVDQGE